MSSRESFLFFFALKSCQWSLMSLITGNKVKKTRKPRYCEKEKDKANKTMAWSSLAAES